MLVNSNNKRFENSVNYVVKNNMSIKRNAAKDESKTLGLAQRLRLEVQGGKPFHFTKAKEILGSDDAATKALKRLNNTGVISRIKTEEWRSYGITDKDHRLRYYVLSEASWAQKEWDKVSETIKDITAKWDNGKKDCIPLIDAVLSVIGMAPGIPSQPTAQNMAMYRKKDDIDTLLKFYKILNSESPDNDYGRTFPLMGFMLECVSQTPLIGPGQGEELAIEFRKMCEGALKKMKDSTGNAINSRSPMSLALLSFKSMVALHDADIMVWMGETLLSLIEDIRGMDDSHRKNAIHGLHVFVYFIKAYRERYPKGFITANRSELAFELLKIILGSGTDSLLRDTLYNIRTELLSETPAPVKNAES